MAKKQPKLYGLLAKFDTPENLVSAARRVVQAGYRKFDAYTPYPVEELDRAMRLKPSPLPYVILAGGILGRVGGFFMQAYATVVDLPLNIGGRPLFSWPTYIPISFELTILLAAFAGVLGLFAVTRLPVDANGRVSVADFERSLRSDTVFASVMAANNEIGTLQPVNEIGALCRELARSPQRRL